MKKTWSFILLLLVMCAAVLPFSAAAEHAPSVQDDSGVLSDYEYEALSERLDALRSTYNVDAAFIISNEAVMGDAQAKADDIYDYGGYGIGENHDGILYFVSKSSRKYAFSTCGRAIEIFNDDGLEYIDNAMLSYLKKGEYYRAGMIYADKCEELMEMAANGKPYKNKINILYAIAGIIFIPLVIALILMARKLSKMNTAVMQHGAANYIKPGSMNIDFSRDIFLYSTVSKTEKPKSDSTTHTSSSGTEHGGRSGSF